MTYTGPIVDVDVHHRWMRDPDLIAYLPEQWRDLITHSRGNWGIDSPTAPMFHYVGGAQKRRDSYPPTGGPPGSHYETMREQWLDPYPVKAAVLTFDLGTQSGVPNPYLASALCRAANDWNADSWLSNDDPRLCGSVLIPTQLPDDGAAEIRRVGANPRIVEALLVHNGLGEPFGHPVYHPIYEAAVEMDLPIAIHLGGDSWTHTTHMNAGGMPNTRFEYHTIAAHSAQLHVASLITHGVFEKYPSLRVLIVETGVTWIPWLFWGLDGQYEALRRESSFVKRLPSEYLREHIRLSTQPLEDPPKHAQLIELFEAFGGMEDILMFSSDYPHWDADDPRYIARVLPESWWSKVFHDNAAAVLRLPDETRNAEPRAATVGARS